MPRYAFGPFLLDPEARVLLRTGKPLSMAGKTFDTLLILIQNRGRLVDKDELLSRIWAGTAVEEANLSQSIFTARRILGDSPKDHRYIATVPGRGYQFVASVTEVACAEPAVEKANKGRRLSNRHRAVRFGVAGALLAGVAMAAFWRFRQLTPAEWLEPIPFTSRIGHAGSPSFSPDGKQIAYSWGPLGDPTASIYVKQVGTEAELRVTNSPGEDVLPAWSPDGRFLAFYRRVEGRSGYYIVSVLGGPIRLLAASTDTGTGGGLDWSPDGRHIIFPRIPPSWARMDGWNMHWIASLDIETGEQTFLTRPKRTEALMDTEPAVSPDGRMLAFVRWRAADSCDLFVLHLDGSPARQLTRFGGRIFGVTWTPDSRELVFAMDQDGRSRLWRIARDGSAAHPITSNIEDLYFPTIARQGHRLAYAVNAEHISLWRTDLSGSHPPSAGASIRLFSSVRSEESPAYSHDGNKIAFASNMTGPSEIWAADAEGRTPVQLTHRGGPDNGTPRWSPDGSQIAFDSRIHGNPEILVVTEEGHNIRRITNNPAEDVVPSWSIDGRWIYFASDRKGDFQIYKVPAESGESPSRPAVQVTRGGGFNCIESPDGQYLYFARGRGKRGLWRRRLDALTDGAEEPVLESLQRWGWWAVGPNGVFFLEAAEQPGLPKIHLKFLDLSSKRITDLRMLEYPVNLWVAPITVSPDGRHALYEQEDNSGFNILLIENFR